ncbi:hypothetical protein DAMA08_002230 [Martiniozyma asiatica (nom. inval.)]|nr:hypothetical protein DAMA08_002230 [Martiniozyma asiatica]
MFPLSYDSGSKKIVILDGDKSELSLNERNLLNIELSQLNALFGDLTKITTPVPPPPQPQTFNKNLSGMVMKMAQSAAQTLRQSQMKQTQAISLIKEGVPSDYFSVSIGSSEKTKFGLTDKDLKPTNYSKILPLLEESFKLSKEASHKFTIALGMVLSRSRLEPFPPTMSESMSVLLGLTDSLLLSGDYTKAWESSEVLLALGPTQAEVYIRKAMAACNLGLWRDANVFITRGLANCEDPNGKKMLDGMKLVCEDGQRWAQGDD